MESRDADLRTGAAPQAGPVLQHHRAGPEAHLDEWVSPDIADERGFLRAGKILEWMDVVGVLAATRHCRCPVVTASVDGLELLHPISVGERVTMKATVGYTSTRSLGVFVTMTHGLPGAVRRSLAAYMTFVALDERGEPAPVPQLRPETPQEVARFQEGTLRREFREKLLSGQLSSAPPPSDGDQTLFTRELLKLLPRTLRVPFDRADGLEPRRRHVSYVHKIEPVRASKLNFHGTLYGGTLMKWLETAATLSARAYLDGAPVRLTGLHGLTFIRPVRRHVFVHVRSNVAHTDAKSLTVLVDVDAEQPLAGEHEETLRAFLTYSPADGRAGIPPLECISDDERAAFAEVEHRLALQRSLPQAGAEQS
jgi:acyl-CoA hydrolase